MSFGVGVGDIALVASFAWQTYVAIKNAPSEFRALESEVQSLSISLKSFDDDDTKLAILNYTNGNVQREENFRSLMKNSRAALKPLNDLVINYHVKSPAEKGDVRDWLTGARFARKNLSVQDFRNKLSMHTASLNIFLSSLTNFSIARLEKLIFAGTSSGGGTKGFPVLGNTNNSSIGEDGLDGTWSAIGPSLVRDSMTRNEVASKIVRFRVDILNYMDFLMDGGRPYSRKELNRRRDETKTVTFSLPLDMDDLQMKKSRSHTSNRDSPDLMKLVDQMVTFDEDGSEEEDRPIRRNSSQVPQPYFSEPSPSPKQSPRTPSASMGPPAVPAAPLSGSPRIITMEPYGSPKSPNPNLYSNPADSMRPVTGNRERTRPGSFSIARGGSLQGQVNSPMSPTNMGRGASLQGQMNSPISPTNMTRTPSGGITYARSPSIGAIPITRTSVPILNRPRSPPYSKVMLSSPPNIKCDNCRRVISTGARYFHCGRCAAAGYDVCKPCYDEVHRCPGRREGRHEKMEARILGMLY